MIATHLHTDHTGLAGWITREWDCELWMSRSDFYMCKVMAADGPSDVPEDAIRFYRRAGFTEDRLDRYRQRFGTFGANIAPLPAGYRRINDGQYLEVGDREWRVLIGHGHAPEHVCLYCPALKLIIGGDQLLPKITPKCERAAVRTAGQSAERMDYLVCALSRIAAAQSAGSAGA